MAMLKCPAGHGYTLKEKCGVCGAKTSDPRPPRYSPVDKFGKWRRIAKREMAEKRGWQGK